MFKRISPQKVQHSTGYLVQVLDRETIEYVEGDVHVTVQVDFGPSVGVYKRTLKGVPSGADQERVWERIIAGLKAMGCAVEIC